MGSRYPIRPVVLPRQPRLDHLVRVVPIAQVQEANGIEVLSLSLEEYTAGFVVTLQSQSHGTVPFIDAPPWLTLSVMDDCERKYGVVLGGAAGEGGGRDWQWRHTYRCFPPLPPDATALRMMLRAMEWRVPDRKREEYAQALMVEGPWTFTVPLPPIAAMTPQST